MSQVAYKLACEIDDRPCWPVIGLGGGAFCLGLLRCPDAACDALNGSVEVDTRADFE